MRVILGIWIFGKGDGLHSVLSKEYNTDLVPVLGAEIEDSAWKEPKIPVSISCNFDEGYYYLNFKNVKLNTKDHCDKEVKMYLSHGWKST